MLREDEIGIADLVKQMRIANRLLVTLVNMQAAQLKKPLTQQQQIALLAGTGVSAQEIADVLDTTPSTVRKAFTRIRRSGGHPKGDDGDTGAASPT